MIRAHLRCSSDSQDTASQRDGILRWLGAYSNEAPVWYEEDGVSGDAKARPVRDRLLAECRKGDTVVCWALDRLSRAGIVPTLQLVQEFTSRGIRLVSVSEPWLDTDNPVSEVVLAVLAWAAQQEKRRIKARVLAGIEAARKRNGGKCPWAKGRAPGTRQAVTEEKEALVRRLASEGKPKALIARLTGLSRPTIYAVLEKP